MAERPVNKPEIASQKRVIKLTPAIGDWTTYRPLKILVKKVRSGLYGFDRLSKEELNQALRLHYLLVQALLTRLKIDLKMGVEFYACQIEQTNYLNFLRTLGSPVLQGKITIPNVHEGVQALFDIGLTHSIINHAMGSQDAELLNRGLTEAENTVFSTALTEYLPLYARAFENTIGSPAFSIVGSPEVALDPSINPSSTFVCFSAEVSFNENPSGKIIFGYLAGALKSLLKAAAEKNNSKSLNFGRLSSSILGKITVPIKAVLGSTNLLTSEIHALEVGDVVSLDTSITSAVNLAVGNIMKTKVQPGIKNKKKAVRLSGFKEEEEIEIIPPREIVEKVEETKPVTEELPKPEEEATPKEEELAGEESEEEEFPEEDLFEEEEEEFPEEEEEEENKEEV